MMQLLIGTRSNSSRSSSSSSTDSQAQVQKQAPTAIVLPVITIRDGPKLQWRGLLLDVCRHFFDKDFVKRYIDLLALYRMNVFHWHLTEDQAFRIEIKRYPKLTSVGAYRELRPDELSDEAFMNENKQYISTRRDSDGRTKMYYGGYYTQEDIREIVAYASDRFIRVVPEIELPGHAVASLAAYPEHSCTASSQSHHHHHHHHQQQHPHQTVQFTVENNWGVHKDVYCAGNDATFEFLENVLTEVIDLFPNSTHIHIGGDECPKDRWSVCPKCQQRIRDEHLGNEHGLQSYFIRRIGKFLASKNRQFIGWDEILEGGLAPGAIVQAWRGMNGALDAVRMGHDAIASPNSHCYLDYDINTIDLEHLYSFRPEAYVRRDDAMGRILGGEVNCWTEHMRTRDRVNYMVFPRLLAMSEVLWSEHRDTYYDFWKRVVQQRPVLHDLFQVRMGPETDLLHIVHRVHNRQTVFVRAYLKKPNTSIPRDKLELAYSLDETEPSTPLRKSKAQSFKLGEEISFNVGQTMTIQAYLDGVPYGKHYHLLSSPSS